MLGDFNGWQVNDQTSKMEIKDGSYEKSVKLKNGQQYEFRYLCETKGWFNDEAADSYVESPYKGFENGIVDLVAIPVPKRVVKKAAKKLKKDDLKKIEGIGPKIASILTDNNIGTFEKLSKAPVKKLEAILKEAGPRFSMHKPGSWPKQAKLASQEKWDELKVLQDKLDRGK